MLKRIKVLRGYTEHARFIAECEENPIGEIPTQKDIPSPYSYSPTHTVWIWNKPCNGFVVVIPHIIVEVKHRRYEVYAVPRRMIIEGGLIL